MALQTEIWISSIINGLFADNSFLSHAVNHDQFVNNKTVHVPNAGKGSGVKKNRSTYPASVGKRTDVDLTYQLDTYTTDPVHLPNAESIELSYDKRESVLSQDRATLHDSIAKGMLKNWAPDDASRIIATTGKAVVAHTTSATGNRKAITKADVLSLMTQFNKDNVPSEGRWLLLDAVMYSQLLADLTTQEATAFHALADPARGIMGKLFTFNILQRSEVVVYDGNSPKEVGENPQAADKAAAIAWHEQSVARAMGETQMYSKEGDPTYYGDIYSFEVRMGGAILRADKKGVAAIVQSPTA